MANPTPKKQNIIRRLKRGVFDIVYRKKSDGSVRKAKATLDPSVEPSLGEWKRKGGYSPSDTVPYWDLGKNKICSFKDYYLQRIKLDAEWNKKKKAAEKKAEPEKDSGAE